MSYFAGLPKEEVAAELLKRENDWFDHLRQSGIMNSQRRAYQAYYGENATTSRGQIADVGENGQFKSLIVNEYRNFLQHQLNLTTQTRLNYQPRATNTDAKSLGQAVLAKSLIDYYTREKDLEDYLFQATEIAIATSESFIKLDWNTELGDRTLENKYEGDVEIKTYFGVNVVRDFRKQSNLRNQWVILRDRRNKYDLIAQYPELAEQIEGFEDERSGKNSTFLDELFEDNTAGEDDDIYVKEFWHEKTPSMPHGRLIIYVNDEIVLFDGPLPYAKSHIYRICPSQVIGTNHSYSSAFDLLPLQETLDALISSVVTNQTTFGVQMIAVKNGGSFDVESIGGLNILHYDEVEPKPVNMTATAPEIFNFIGNVREMMGTQTGISELQRGHAPDGITAGNALALLQSQSIQFNSGLQRGYAKLAEGVATGILSLNQQFADSPRNVYIVGVSNRGYMKKYTGKDLTDVNRVTVEMANPVLSTSQGRKAMSDEWVTKGVMTPQQQLAFINTGNFEVLSEKYEKEYILIKDENESLGRGEDVPVLSFDMHKEHIEEHRAVLSSVDVRRDSKILLATLKHIHLHMAELGQQDPNLLAMFNQPALPPSQPQQGMEIPADNGQGQPMMDQPPVDMAQNVVEQNNPQMGAMPQAEMPNPPSNPATGQEAQMPTNLIPR